MLDAVAKEALRLHATAPIGSIRQALTKLHTLILSVVPSFCPFVLCSFTHGFSTQPYLGVRCVHLLSSFRYEVLILCIMEEANAA